MATNKFAERKKTLDALSDIAATIDYHIDDETQTALQYWDYAKDYAKENGSEEDFLEEDYRVDIARDHELKAAIWKSVMAYLEKTYL